MTRIILFIKIPQIGQVKTRLANDLGAPLATHLYKQLIFYTQKIVRKTGFEWTLYLSGELKKNAQTAFLAERPYRLQKGNDLGKRMLDAVRRELKTSSKVIVIGSDCASIKTEDLKRASMILSKKPCVLGPAKDGGYYLIGFSRHILRYQGGLKQVFGNIRWSRRDVLRTTMGRLNRAKIPYACLSVKSDWDTSKDIRMHEIDLLYR